MKVSIITPSFNQGKFIEETIRSVIYQKGDFELEYIIMDNCSSDGSLDIIKKYDKITKSREFKPLCKKVFFQWFSKKDTGQSNAINKGFHMASGEIINWLCSDDILEQGALQKVCDFFRKNPSAMVVFGKSFLIDENGKINENVSARPFNREELIRCWNAVYNSFSLPQATTFVRKDILNSIGFLDERLHLSMDYEWYLRINKKYRFYFLDDYLSRDRFHIESKAIKYKKKQYRITFRISRKYWNENYFYYFSSYAFNLMFRWFYTYSFRLKKIFPFYNRFIGYLKQYRLFKIYS